MLLNEHVSHVLNAELIHTPHGGHLLTKNSNKRRTYTPLHLMSIDQKFENAPKRQSLDSSDTRGGRGSRDSVY